MDALALLAEVSLKATLLLALAGGLALALRRAPARTRGALWGAALVGALLLPVLAPWLPSWSLPLPALPGGDFFTAPASLFRSPPAASPHGHSDGAGIPRTERKLSERGWSGWGAASFEHRPQGSPPRRSEPASAGRDSPKVAFPWPSAALAVWLLGAAGILLGHGLGLARLARLTRRARPLEDEGWRRELERCRRSLGISRPARLLAGEEIPTPMTFGVRRPVILLPAGAAAWSAERRRLVLLHELEHARRGDWPLRQLARLARALYWFHPLAWLALRRLVLEQERACDDAVVAHGTRPSTYAAHLLALARGAVRPRGLVPRTALPALDMARRSQMEDRLMSILNRDRSRDPRHRGRAPILPVLLFLALVPALAAVETWSQEAAPAPQAEMGVEQNLSEIARLEERLRPLQEELENLAEEMEPLHRELEGIAEEMEPFEVRMDDFEIDMEPFEARMEEIEIQMEPFEEQLEEIEVRMEPFEARMEAIEVDMEPFEAQLDALDEEMEPFEDRLEAIEEELEPMAEEMERLGEEMEALAEGAEEDPARRAELEKKAAALQEAMRPLREAMGGIHEEMRPIFERMGTLHEQMQPFHQQMAALHEEMRPIFEQMGDIHIDMEPFHEQMRALHEQMRPLHEHTADIHKQMEPFHQRMGEVHERMAPFHERMGEIQQRMEPLRRDLERRHEDLRRGLAAGLEPVLRAELAPVTTPDAPFAAAARRLAESAAIHTEGPRSRLLLPEPAIRETLTDLFTPHRDAAEAPFQAALDRATQAAARLARP